MAEAVPDRFNVRLGPLVITKIKDNEERVYYEDGQKQWSRLKEADMLLLQRKLIEFQGQLNDMAMQMAGVAAAPPQGGGFPKK